MVNLNTFRSLLLFWWLRQADFRNWGECSPVKRGVDCVEQRCAPLVRGGHLKQLRPSSISEKIECRALLLETVEGLAETLLPLLKPHLPLLIELLLSPQSIKLCMYNHSLRIFLGFLHRLVRGLKLKIRLLFLHGSFL